MNAIPKKVGLLLVGLAGCGKLADSLFCESQGCDWRPGEWQRVAALANPGPPPEDKSNGYVGNSAAELLGQAFFFDPAFSGQASGVDAINRPAPSSRTPACPPMLGISCASCHDLGRAGIDTTSLPGQVSVGAGWTDVNALAVVNAAYRPVVFWNGRADSLWALNAVVAESPTTLNGNRLRTVHQIADRYAGFYQQVFGAWDDATRASIAGLPANGKPKDHGAFDALSDAQKDLATGILVNWAKAIAAYEYRLTSAQSPFDQFVAEGPKSTRISEAAKRGARLFVGKGACIDCHGGPQLTDEQFHNIGVPQTGTAVPKVEDCPASNDPPNAACDCVSADALKCAPWGAYDGLRRLRTTDANSPIRNAFLRTSKWSSNTNDTSRQAYIDIPLTDDLKGAWRTPSLRNVALTAPYMHDGRYATLEDVIWHYNTGGRNAGPEQVNPDGIAPEIKPLMLTEGEVGDLVAFLESLTGAPVREELTVAPKDVGLPTGVGGAGGAACNSSSGAGGTGGSSIGPGMGGGGGGAPTGAGGGSGHAPAGGPGQAGSGGLTGSAGFGGLAGSQASGAGGTVTGSGGMATTGPLACTGTRIGSPLITDFEDASSGIPVRFGTKAGIPGETFARAPAGMSPPRVSLVPGAGGGNALSFFAPASSANAGPAVVYEFGLRFYDCVNASAYNAVRFTITSTATACATQFGIVTPPNATATDDPRGTCTASTCYPMQATFLGPGARTLPFASGTDVPVDPTSTIGITWRIPTMCGVSMTIDDISFVNQ
jgi:cytochrome c peroxidase